MTPAATDNPTISDSPFLPGAHAAYRVWRDHKLTTMPKGIEALRVVITNPDRLKEREHSAILSALSRSNLAIYRCEQPLAGKQSLRQLGRQLGLLTLDANLCADKDSITSLRDIENTATRGYIPYTNKRLSWHTDGYYNPMDRQIRAIIMHCVSPAAEGGENMYLDHEMLYIQLRDENPDYIAALMHPEAMSIPPNVEDGQEIRGETVGPVFSIDPSGHLHMRYSARTRNISWRNDATTQAAANRITELLNESPYILRYRLDANEGVISNNVLHNRTAFVDDAKQRRLLYRARYYERAYDGQVVNKEGQ